MLNTIDKWQQGHRRAALAAAKNKTVEKVTVTTWAEAYEMMCKYGFAVLDNFTQLFYPDVAPDEAQRDYMYNRKYNRYCCYTQSCDVICIVNTIFCV